MRPQKGQVKQDVVAKNGIAADEIVDPVADFLDTRGTGDHFGGDPGQAGNEGRNRQGFRAYENAHFGNRLAVSDFDNADFNDFAGFGFQTSGFQVQDTVIVYKPRRTGWKKHGEASLKM